MTDVKDLARFVEDHPEDHESRWRLAKKLYMASDYAAVLEHLQVLQAQWVPKVNVRRYLGATYYRLQRYDEAIKELRAAVDEWPDELALREQLARVLEVAGHQADADHVWQDIGRRDPTRMGLRTDDTPKPAGPLAPAPEAEKPSRSGLSAAALAMGRICPSCGTQNTEEFERCWKCHAELGGRGGIPNGLFAPLLPTPSPNSTPRVHLKPPPATHELWHIPVAVLGGLLLLAGIYLTIAHLAALRSFDSAALVSTTVREVFERRLAGTHLVVGIALLLAWPGSLWLAATLVPGAEVPARTVVILGAVLGAFAYLLSWVPPQWLGYVAIGLLVLSAVGVMVTFRMEARRALAAWAIHAVLLVSVLLVVVAALEGFSVIIEYPAMARYARTHDTVSGQEGDPGRTAVPAFQLPRVFTVTFRSSGSTWLDAKVTAVSFEIIGARQEDNLSVELKDENRTRYYGHADKDRFLFMCEIVPNRPYQLTLDGKDTGHVELVIRSALVPEFKE